MASVRKKPSLDFSLTGLVYTSMMLFMGLAALNSQANLLFAVFGLMIGVLLASIAISRIVLRRIEVTRLLPEMVVVGQPATFQYVFHNRNRFWPSLSVTVGELTGAEAFAKQPQAYLLHAAAGTKAAIPMQVVPKRRGLHQLDEYQLSTSFPFGFIKRAIKRRQKDGVLVYPAIAQVDRKFLSTFLSAELSGARMKPRRGGSDEFYGVKEYRIGENPRWIHWRRSAHTGLLVAKEMTRVAPPRLMVLVDTHIRERTRAEHAAVERAIAMAGSLIARALDEGFAVGLGAWSGDWVVVAPSRGKRHARDLMVILARLGLNLKVDAGELVEHGRRHVQSGTTTVLFTPREVVQAPAEKSRNRLIVVCAASEQANCSFRFSSDVEFGEAMPVEQEPMAK